MSEIKLRQEGANVLVIYQGKLVFKLPWQAALEVAQGIRAKAKLAEECAKVDQVIFDNAILTRAGWPVGLASSQKIMQEVAKEAVSNRALRRYMPGGVRSSEVIGAPTITQR